MNKLRFCLVLLFLTCAPFPTRADKIDQSFTGPITGGADINECCAFIGQTYTAGLSGTLAAVSLDVVETPGNSFPLVVQIRTVSGGFPTTTVLGETITTAFGSGDLIKFSQVIPQITGTQYAIVVSFLGAPPEGPGHGVGTWFGSGGYGGGMLVASDDGGITWPNAFVDFDQHFVTHVNTVPEPGVFLLLGSGFVSAFFIWRCRRPVRSRLYA